jgi:hypothetical protein
MNIKTTIILFLLLAGVGSYVYYTRDKSGSDDTTPARQEPKTLLDLKDKADKITAFSISGSNGKEIVAEKSNGNWKMTKPVNAALDKDKVDSLLQTLTTLQSTEQISGAGTAPSNSGLDRPTYTLDLTCEDGKGKTDVKLLVGDRLAGESVYTQVKGHDMIDIVPSSLLDTLGAPANSLRNSNLFDFAAASVQQMNITEKDGSELSLRNSPTGWRLTHPVTIPADAAAVEDLTAAVVNMRVVEFMDHPTLSMGLSKPQAIVTLSTAAPASQPTTMPMAAPKATPMAATMTTPVAMSITTNPVKVIFGGYDDISMQNVYAQIPDGTVVKVPVSVLQALDKKPLDLRDKNVVDIDPAQVSRITIAVDQIPSTQPATKASKNAPPPPTPPVPVVLVHRQKAPPATRPATTLPLMGPILPLPQGPRTEWAIAGATQSDADDSKVSALLGQFHPLHVEKYVEASAAPKSGKRMSVTFEMKDSKTPIVLTLINTESPANLVGSYDGLTFELQRQMGDDLGQSFAPAPPGAVPSMPPGGMPPGGMPPGSMPPGAMPPGMR